MYSQSKVVLLWLLRKANHYINEITAPSLNWGGLGWGFWLLPQTETYSDIDVYTYIGASPQSGTVRSSPLRSADLWATAPAAI
jgi:hypothetical protein